MATVADPPLWTEAARGAAAIAQIFALCVGGLWAYFKFRRSRMFVIRVEWDIDATYLHTESEHGVKVRATLRNPGNSDLHFDEAALALYAVDSEAWSEMPLKGLDVPKRPVGFELAFYHDAWGSPVRPPVRIFEDHGWVRSGETITDEYLLRDPVATRAGHAPLAYKVRAVVRDDRKKEYWVGSAVVAARLAAHDPQRSLAGTTPAA